ncbi:serine hydrolase domain-containing protein [Vallitalea maricola]|uniref:Serine hydrolase domain-containing protein n=1 Tax=Vallitalea maricola TaxID=3074433 RepID=A0ACB5UK07_9FIRM|nr:serine hydrolase domain-containing protein [Vallitalea sp. AN17-2]
MGKKGIIYTIIILVMMSMFSTQVKANKKVDSIKQVSLDPTTEADLEKLINSNMQQGHIPGLALVIIKDGQVFYKKGFGYADVKRKKEVTSKTFFEIGSNSKAFTALGILKLEKEGKIQLEDSVTKYIPWFKMRYVGMYQGEEREEYVDITINQLLHHTSGITSKSIADIPISNEEDALEKTVKTQVNKKLAHYPGENFEYATINYDILGLVIQNVTSMSYENYMKENILKPLGLNETYTHKNNHIEKDMATGYKVQYLKARPFNAPIYKGNTPAGYLISNLDDMEKWVKIQLGIYPLQDFDEELIKTSHIPDTTVSPGGDGSSYAYGWLVYQEGEGVFTHAGNNPNYSSYILIRPDENLGICVLSNINSAYTMDLGKSIYRILNKEEPINYTKDIYSTIDKKACIVIIIGVVMILILLFLLVRFVLELINGKRNHKNNGKKIITTIIGALLITVIISYCLYRIPHVLFYGLPWCFIKVWAPQSILTAIMLLIIVVVLFCIYFVLKRIYPKK